MHTQILNIAFKNVTSPIIFQKTSDQVSDPGLLMEWGKGKNEEEKSCITDVLLPSKSTIWDKQEMMTRPYRPVAALTLQGSKLRWSDLHNTDSEDLIDFKTVVWQAAHNINHTQVILIEA